MRMPVMMMVVVRVTVVTGGMSVGGQGALSNLVERKLYSIRTTASNHAPAIPLAR